MNNTLKVNYNEYEVYGYSDVWIKSDLTGTFDPKTKTSNWKYNIYVKDTRSSSNVTVQYSVKSPSKMGSSVTESSITYKSDSSWRLIATVNFNSATHTFNSYYDKWLVDFSGFRYSLIITSDVHTSVSDTRYAGGDAALLDFNDGAYTLGNSKDVIDGARWYCTAYDPSTVAATHSNIGSESTITITNIGKEVTHTVYYSYDNGTTLNQIGAAKRTDRQIKWTVPDDFYAQIPNARQGDIGIYVQTYDGDMLVGTQQSTKIKAYTVEADCKPTLSPTVKDTNSVTIALTGSSAKLIRARSHAQYTVNAAARKSATITSIEVKNGSNKLYTATGTFKNPLSNDFTFYVTDSRGYTTSTLLTPSMVQYTPLTCLVTASAPTADGVMSFAVHGDYFSGNFGAISNTLVVKYRIKEGNNAFSEWLDITPQIAGGTYTGTITLEGLDYMSPYTIEGYAVDKFGTVYSSSEMVSAIPIFDWSVNDFNMNVPMTVYGKLTVNGDVVVTGEINGTQGAGTSGGMHFGSSITESTVSAKLVTCSTFTELEKGASIRVKFTYGNNMPSPTMNVNNTGPVSIKCGNISSLAHIWRDGEVKDFVYDGTYWQIVDGGNASGSWTPVLNVSATYTTQQGWYQRIGNCITIGFNVTATVNSGSNEIIITGLPHTPKYIAFGGGVAQNINTLEGQVFEGWKVSTDGTIKAVSKTLDGTIKYPPNSGVITIGGTICYTI